MAFIHTTQVDSSTTQNTQTKRKTHAMTVVKSIKTPALNDQFPINAVSLTPESFAEFGSIISADHQLTNIKKSSANQGTAIKLHKVAPVINNFKDCKSGLQGTANWNIFRCSPPMHLLQPVSNDKGEGKREYLSKVLERHPYSTQTFVPLGRSKSSVGYLVIVAPNDELTAENLPDHTKLKAFVCKGNQSVTYGVGTWHAPMIALGDNESEYLDFAVLVHENGVDQEDCEEVVYDPGMKVVF